MTKTGDGEVPTEIRYVETSALLAALLERDLPARRSLRSGGTLVTSALTFAEAGRALVRARRAGRLSASQAKVLVRALAKFRARCVVVSVTDEVLAASVRPFPVEPIRTLDALHLSTAASVTDAPGFLTMVTREDRVRANAEAMGFVVE